jgi:hypothetical protein
VIIWMKSPFFTPYFQASKSRRHTEWCLFVARYRESGERFLRRMEIMGSVRGYKEEDQGLDIACPL